MRPVLVITTGLLAAGALSACGSSPSATTAGGTAPSSASSQQGKQGQQGYGGTGTAQRFPGTSGTIADISGTTLQVQNQTDGQVAVTYGSTTTFTAQVAASLSDVKVGSCVTVTPVTSSSSSSSGSASAGAVTAGAVRITPPQNGSCTGGFGAARGGNGPSGLPSGRPSDLPSGAPSGAPNGATRSGFFGGTNGTVASVTATGFTVTEQRPDFSQSGGRPSAGASPSMTTSTVTVTVDGSTTYSTTKAADSSALAVGKCVTATGQANDTGTVAATRIAVSDPENGQCGGFGTFGGPGGAGAAPGGVASGGAA